MKHKKYNHFIIFHYFTGKECYRLDDYDDVVNYYNYNCFFDKNCNKIYGIKIVIRYLEEPKYVIQEHYFECSLIIFFFIAAENSCIFHYEDIYISFLYIT